MHFKIVVINLIQRQVTILKLYTLLMDIQNTKNVRQELTCGIRRPTLQNMNIQAER